MTRSDQGSTKTIAAQAGRSHKFGLIVGTALASLALAGCASSAPPAQVSFAKAQDALEAGNADRAIEHAEAAVLADPRNPQYRAVLGAAYLEAGRYQSAATTFGEALELGESDHRTVLTYALTKVATGDNEAALAELTAHEDRIAPADLGLAIALAGQPDRGVQYLVNAVRGGHSTPKARQNLAYAYALAGNWPAARVMAAEDVPAHLVDERLAQWASNAHPEHQHLRVAALLGIAHSYDEGQPRHLALANFPSQPSLVEEAAQYAEVAPVSSDNAPVMVAAAANEPANPSVPAVQPAVGEQMAFGIADIDAVDPNNALGQPVASMVSASAAPSVSSSRPAPRFVSNAVVQEIPVSAPRSAPAPVPSAAPNTGGAAPQTIAIATGSAATHLVQLGSFDSRAVAQSKWGEFQRRYASLQGRDVVITEARVNGRTFYRVAATGFGASSARSMCNTVKSSGAGCFAYSAANPPAGAVKSGS